jgi:hypothetical protein
MESGRKRMLYMLCQRPVDLNNHFNSGKLASSESWESLTVLNITDSKNLLAQVWANLTQHDSVIFHDNDFEVGSHMTTPIELRPRGDSRVWKISFDWDICK